jgi:dienelactone hydrolase
MSVSGGPLGLAAPALPGFEQFAFASGGFSHLVYHAGDPGHPPLLLMPEIAGMSPGLVLFARRLVQSRFRVYIPWLFGPFQQRAPLRNAIKLCVSREFANLRAGVSAPVTHWLRALAGHISECNGGSRVGAIGMCLTGAFAIPLVIDPQVVAAVAAQPSVPLSPLFAWLGVGRGAWMHELNIGDDDIAKVRARLDSGQAKLLAVRCHADRICPHEKLQRLQKEFPAGLETREYGDAHSRNRLGDRPHATFTKEYRLEPEASDDHHSRQAYADLLAFFDRHLSRHPREGGDLSQSATARPVSFP